MDHSKLETLGPYALVIHIILSWSNKIEPKRDEALRMVVENGKSSPYDVFSQCFVTLRGAKMDDPKWFNDYKDKVVEEVYLPGSTSTSM